MTNQWINWSSQLYFVLLNILIVLTLEFKKSHLLIILSRLCCHHLFLPPLCAKTSLFFLGVKSKILKSSVVTNSRGICFYQDAAVSLVLMRTWSKNLNIFLFSTQCHRRRELHQFTADVQLLLSPIFAGNKRMVAAGLDAHTGWWAITSPLQANSLNIWWILNIIITSSPAGSLLLTHYTPHSSHLCLVNDKWKLLLNHQFAGNNLY